MKKCYEGNAKNVDWKHEIWNKYTFPDKTNKVDNSGTSFCSSSEKHTSDRGS